MARSRRNTTGTAVTVIDGGVERCQRSPAPPLLSPGLALVAAAAFLEAYEALHVLPASRWTSGIVFAMLAAPLTALLTRPPAGGHREWHEDVVIAAAVLVVVTTALNLAVEQSTVVVTRGASDLLLAVAALGTAVATEIRRMRLSDPGQPGPADDRGRGGGLGGRRPVGVRLEEVHDEGLEPDPEERPLLIFPIGTRRTKDAS
jgi:hypothetical protein